MITSFGFLRSTQPQIPSVTLLPWNPDANNTVRAIAISGNEVFIGGDFTSVGGETRNRLAAIEI